MENQIRANRVETALKQWLSNEERLTKLFPASTTFSNALLHEKLNYYQRIIANIGNIADTDEKIAIRLVKQESQVIEKQLYPNFIVRLLRRLLISPIRKQMSIIENKRQSNLNLQSLHEAMNRTGFGKLTDKLSEAMNTEKDHITLPLSYYINSKERLEHELSFKRDQNGNFHFEGYKTSLYIDTKPQEHKEQYFDLKSGYDLHVDQAYNLLQGRSVYKNENWIQLDLNDKNVEGNHRIKEFRPDYGYDLDNVLNALPLSDHLDKYHREQLKGSLSNGNRESITFLKNGEEKRFFIEANPHFKSITIYDEHFRKVTLGTATGMQNAESLKPAHKVNEGDIQQRKNLMRIVKG